jgi:hypothetical protein
MAWHGMAWHTGNKTHIQEREKKRREDYKDMKIYCIV